MTIIYHSYFWDSVLSNKRSYGDRSTNLRLLYIYKFERIKLVLFLVGTLLNSVSFSFAIYILLPAF